LPSESSGGATHTPSHSVVRRHDGNGLLAITPVVASDGTLLANAKGPCIKKDTNMLQVSIWQLSPPQHLVTKLIGSIALDECDPPSTNRLSVRVSKPGYVDPEDFFLAGSLVTEKLIRVVADLIAHLDPERYSESPHGVQRRTDEPWRLLLSVTTLGSYRREVARLTADPAESDRTLFSAHWTTFSSMDRDYRAQLGFYKVPSCPWQVLRAATAAMAQMHALPEVGGLRCDDLIVDESAEGSGE